MSSVTSHLRGIETVPSVCTAGGEQEDVAQLLQRIERLGKHLFGVALCVLHLEEDLRVKLDWQVHEEIAVFRATQPAKTTLQILPDSSSPFQSPLGRVAQRDVRFYLAHPVRSGAGEIAGSLVMLHDRPRAFTNGDHALLADVLALIEHQLQRVSS